MKNTVTIILVTALVVFSAYYTSRKVRDNAGFMVPAVDMRATVKETGPRAVKKTAVKTENKIDALVTEEMLEKPAGKSGADEKAQSSAEDAIEGPAGDVQPVEKMLHAAEGTAAALTEKTVSITEDIVMEEEAKDTLLSEIQEIIAAAEEAAVGTEEKIEDAFAGGAVEGTLSAAEVEGNIDVLQPESITPEPVAAVKPVEETGEMLEALLAEEETGGPVRDALPVFTDEFAEEVKENVNVSGAEAITEEVAEDILPVVEAEKIINAPSEDDMIKEHVKDTLAIAMEGPDVEVKERLETLLAEEAIEGPDADGTGKEPEEKGFAPPAEEATGRPAKDALQTESITDETVEEALPAAVVKPVEGTEERDEALQADEEIEKHFKDVLPALEETPAAAAGNAGNITAEPVEQLVPDSVKPAVEIEDKLDALPVKTVTEEPVEEVMPAAVEGPSVEVEEKIRSLLMEDETGDIFAEAEKRVALLEFDNFSNDMDALKKIMPGLKKRLEKKGLTVVDEDNVSAFLCDEKIRSSSYISNEMLRKVRDKFGVKTILAGSVVSFSSKEDPMVGLLARLIDSSTGGILWADYVSFSGDDFATVLGLGRVKKIEELIARALDKLFISFSTVPVNISNESTYRIAVMPFQNKSRFSNAGIITMHMFLVELLKNDKFEPIEYGEVRKLIVDLRVRSKGELEFRNLKALSGALNVAGVLVGTVEQYSAGIDESSPPKVAMNARLLDARHNRILWYNSHGSNGEKNIIAFEWGDKKPVDKIANGVVSELVQKLAASRLQY